MQIRNRQTATNAMDFLSLIGPASSLLLGGAIFLQIMVGIIAVLLFLLDKTLPKSKEKLPPARDRPMSPLPPV